VRGFIETHDNFGFGDVNEEGECIVYS